MLSILGLVGASLRPVPHSAVPIRRSPYAHWSHPYPLLRRAAPTLVAVYVSYSYPRLLPRPPSVRRLIIAPCFAHPHVGTSDGGNGDDGGDSDDDAMAWAAEGWELDSDPESDADA